jgi:hypothetical protein
MKETVSKDYCPTDNLLQVLGHVLLPKFAKCSLSLSSELCHSISVSVEQVLALCPNQALLLGNAMAYTLRKNSEG